LLRPRAPHLALRAPIALAALAALTALAALSAPLLWSSSARADSPLDGKWKQSALREEYTVQQWLAGCGPTPVSNSTGGGETIQVRQEGDELSFVGGGRVYKTNACYDENPTLVRATHTRDASGRSWQTKCATPQGDSRTAVLSNRVDVTSDTHIQMAETGRYEIVLAEGRCIADIKRSRSFDLIQADNAPAPSAPPAVTTVAPPAPTPEKTAAPRADCSTPGDPARLEVRPSRKLLRTGESFAFRGVVVDANGCGTGQNVTFALANPDDKTKLSVDASGKVTIASDAALGTAELIATASGKTARVTVEVTSPSQYDDLLARSGLNSKGENENAAVTLMGTQSIGGGEGRADDNSKQRRLIFGGVVGALAIALGIAWLMLVKRGRRAKKLEAELEERQEERIRVAEERRRTQRDKYDADVRAHQESVKAAVAASAAQAALLAANAAAPTPAPPAKEQLVCSTCKREYPAGSLFCPHDGNRLQAASEANALSSGSICPACKRGFDPGKKVCPFDGEELIPYAAHAAASKAPAPHAKICPTCGDRFHGSAEFCGKDGTALVLLN
jgi:hypothetical protein